MKEIQITKGETALVDEEDFEWLNQYSWYLSSNGYARRQDWNCGKPKNINMHRMLLDIPDGKQTDHINRNKLDNRKVNLRICTNSENGRNKGTRKGSLSGYKGVSKHRDKWQARIRLNGEQTYLGIFENIIDAALAYNKAAIIVHGEFACLNEF